jgi:hypothetical protein
MHLRCQRYTKTVSGDKMRKESGTATVFEEFGKQSRDHSHLQKFSQILSGTPTDSSRSRGTNVPGRARRDVCQSRARQMGVRTGISRRLSSSKDALQFRKAGSARGAQVGHFVCAYYK